MSDTQIRLFTVSTLLIHAFSSYSRGMTEEIDNSTTTLEIKWRFSRCPENSPERISLKHNLLDTPLWPNEELFWKANISISIASLTGLTRELIATPRHLSFHIITPTPAKFCVV